MAQRRPAPIPPPVINDYEFEEFPKHIYIEPRVKHQKPVGVAKNAADEIAIRERFGLDEDGIQREGFRNGDIPVDARPMRSAPVTDPAQRMRDLEAELAKLRAADPAKSEPPPPPSLSNPPLARDLGQPASTTLAGGVFTAAPVPQDAPKPWSPPVNGDQPQMANTRKKL